MSRQTDKKKGFCLLYIESNYFRINKVKVKICHLFYYLMGNTDEKQESVLKINFRRNRFYCHLKKKNKEIFIFLNF